MSVQQPKTFFIKLKETCKKIDQSVFEVKTKVYDLPGNDDLAAKRICDIQDKIKALKTKANELKLTLEPKLAHTEDFIQHFKDLTSDTEVVISKQEKYLEQYGYKPLELVSASDTTVEEEKYSSPTKETSQVKENGSTTPNLLEFGLVSRIVPHSTTISNDRFSIEDLIPPEKKSINDSLKLQGKDKESTPTLPVSLLHTDDTETPPMPESHQPYILTFPTTPTLEL